MLQFSCNACHCNKSHKLSFSTSTITSTRPLQIIFLDVWTSPILSSNGFKYYIIFVDHFIKYIWLYPLTHKSQVKDVFLRFKAITEKHFHQHIHTLYSDNGGEYIALTSLLALHGISHLTTLLTHLNIMVSLNGDTFKLWKPASPSFPMIPFRYSFGLMFLLLQFT